MSERARIIAMMGLPRSGKSTVSAQLSKLYGAPIVRDDAIRLALLGSRYHFEAEPMVKAISRYMTRALLLSGHEVVIVDETHWSKAARNRLKELGYPITWMVVPTDPDVCIARADRTGQQDLIHVIREMAKRQEPLEPEDEFEIVRNE